jgi:gas vesicle protein
MADSKLPYFLLGIGVGAAVGLLYAPSSGEELRNDLRRRADDSRDFVRRRSSELRDNAEEILDKGRDAVHHQRDQLAAALEAGRKAYREATGRDPANGETRAAGA